MPKPTAPDFAALLERTSQTGGPPTRLAIVLDLLPADQRAKVEAAMRDTTISASRIAKALTKMDPEYACGEGAVATWRRRHGLA